METAHEQDYQRRVTDIGPTRFLPGSPVEIIHELERTDPPQHALFDFDGTLSLIREGWQAVMVPMMVEVLRETGTSETEDKLATLAMNLVMELTGKQTIYQMIRLAAEVAQRGGTPKDPLMYKRRYHERLMERIRDRRDALRTGRVKSQEMLVPFSLNVLDELKQRGVALYLASGTDEKDVLEEAELLGLDDYFGDHIYGAVDEYKTYSKQMVIERILRDNHVEGVRLIGFGDGYVEIDNIKSAGGIAVAVASDEAGRSGKPDPWKRDRLIGVGADIIIPDFQDYDVLLRYLWNEV